MWTTVVLFCAFTCMTVQAGFIEKGDAATCRYAYMVVNALLHYDWPDLLK